MSKNDLRGIVYSMYGNQAQFAKAAGWTKQKASLLITMKREPKIRDLQKMSELLDKPLSEIAGYYANAKGESA